MLLCGIKRPKKENDRSGQRPDDSRFRVTAPHQRALLLGWKTWGQRGSQTLTSVRCGGRLGASGNWGTRAEGSAEARNECRIKTGRKRRVRMAGIYFYGLVEKGLLWYPREGELVWWGDFVRLQGGPFKTAVFLPSVFIFFSKV